MSKIARLSFDEQHSIWKVEVEESQLSEEVFKHMEDEWELYAYESQEAFEQFLEMMKAYFGKNK